MAQLKSYKDVKKRFLADPEFRKEYESLEPEFELTESIIRRRIELKMSQEELAAKVGTGQAAVSSWRVAMLIPPLLHLLRLQRLWTLTCALS